MSDTLTHIKMIHDLAKDQDGKLIIASFGEKNKVEHITIGDYKTMLKLAEKWDAEGQNVYIPLAVMKHELLYGKKGSESDIISVLGLVCDFDDTNAHKWAERLPCEPNYVLETSKGRFQTFFLFNKPILMDEAKDIAERLQSHCQCDTATKDVSHVWRVPGTHNYPNPKKINQGRPPEPQIVRVVKPWKI